MPRSRGSYRGRTPRRRTSWEEGPGGIDATAAITSGPNFLGSVANLLEDELTLLRLRGRFNAILNSASAAGSGFQGAIGIGVTTQPATAVGITAVPTPITEQDWDGWLYWQPISIHAGDATAGSRNWQGGVINIEVDSKAMRKLTDQSSIFTVVELVEVDTADIDMWFDSRVLLALP